MAHRKLTNQQKARIAAIQERRRNKLDGKAAASLRECDGEARPGRVIIRHGQNLVVRTEENQHIHCLFRQNLGDPVCGDLVVWQPTQDGEGVVIAVMPRTTVLARPDYGGREKPLAANISQLVIVLAPEPAPTGYLTDQYLIAAELIGIKALIAVNKADLFSTSSREQFKAEFSHYQDIGYPMIEVSARQQDGLRPLLDRLHGETSILVGQSGVGKSSLINALIPHQQVETGALSALSGLGRHTTSTAKLYYLAEGGELIDSPGVRSFRLGSIDKAQLEKGFREFSQYLGHCKFGNCAHKGEPGCALDQGVRDGTISPRRLESFLNMLGKI